MLTSSRSTSTTTRRRCWRSRSSRWRSSPTRLCRAAERNHGEVMVSSIATLYKKLRLETHENMGWGKIHLPEIELHTTAYWVALGPELRLMAAGRLDMALGGAGRAMQTVASVLLMSDPHDIGMVAQVRSPHAERPIVYLYDSCPAGSGSRRGCSSGTPS